MSRPLKVITSCLVWFVISLVCVDILVFLLSIVVFVGSVFWWIWTL